MCRTFQERLKERERDVRRIATLRHQEDRRAQLAARPGAARANALRVPPALAVARPVRASDRHFTCFRTLSIESNAGLCLGGCLGAFERVLR